MIVTECKEHLQKKILPFWKKLIDTERGGFYGYMDKDLVVDKDAPKGVILNSRILWFFSNSYLTLKDEDDLKYARHAYEFLRDKCYDNEFGGVYWMMNADGSVNDDMKHTYNQAFAIYALASYYDASGNEEALDLAFKLFDTIEEITLDEYGYREAFTRDWHLADNDALSENGISAQKTMNAVLHLIEAYTELIRVKRDKKVKERLTWLLELVKDKIYDEKDHRLLVFFDDKFNVLGDIHSFGHDIEAQWLIDRACEVLGDIELKAEFEKIDLDISENIYNVAFDSEALNNERDGAEINTNRIWWVQAETVVGYINAYQHSGVRKYLDAALTTWEFIKNYLVDERENGEWHWMITKDHKTTDKPIVEPWKCPYHNGRMCFEVIRRGVDD